jgi:hypothetical protein
LHWVQPTCITSVFDALQNSSLHSEAGQNVQMHELTLQHCKWFSAHPAPAHLSCKSEQGKQGNSFDEEQEAVAANLITYLLQTHEVSDYYTKSAS